LFCAACATLVASVAAVGAVTWVKGPGALLYITDHWAELITAALAMSFAQACAVHAMSFQKGTMLAVGGNSTNGFYNVSTGPSHPRASARARATLTCHPLLRMQWFIGRTLNPAIGCFDIKSFNEMRPGLILWVIIDLAWAARQYATIGRVTDGMILTVLFHSWYVFDAEYNEQAMLTTMVST